jgi:hypothetical protein
MKSGFGDDAEHFKIVKESFCVLGMNDEQEKYFSFLSAILHLGNIKFEGILPFPSSRPRPIELVLLSFSFSVNIPPSHPFEEHPA